MSVGWRPACFEFEKHCPHGGQSTFNFNISLQKSKKKTKIIGSFSYSDPVTPLSFSSNKITSLTFNGNQAHVTGTAKLGKKSQISFTVDVTDNGSPGTLDVFSLSVSNDYSVSGHPTSGNIMLH